MKRCVAFLVLTAVAAPLRMAAQDAGLAATPAAEPDVYERPVSWKTLIPNAASDQKNIWLFPRKLVHKKVLIPTLAVLGATAGLVALDPKVSHYFRNTTSFNGFNRPFNGTATAYGTVAVPVAFYVAGMIGKNSKLTRTALLSAEAVGNVEILTIVFKDVDRRLRPADVPPNGNFGDTWFEDNGRNFRSNGSFPSGHTIAAFAVATVVSRRYPHHRWLPYVAYGMASLVGFSRVSLSSHFLSDVFMGGALGYSISRFTVLRQ